MNVEDIHGSKLALALSEKGVASITITRTMSLDKIVKEMDDE
jgi:hypothetical protein